MSLGEFHEAKRFFRDSKFRCGLWAIRFWRAARPSLIRSCERPFRDHALALRFGIDLGLLVEFEAHSSLALFLVFSDSLLCMCVAQVDWKRIVEVCDHLFGDNRSRFIPSPYRPLTLNHQSLSHGDGRLKTFCSPQATDVGGIFHSCRRTAGWELGKEVAKRYALSAYFLSEMPRKKPRYRLRLISGELRDEMWSALATHEGLTPKDGYVEWQMDDYSETGNEVFDFLGSKGMLVLGWSGDSEEDPPDDLWSQVDQIIRDLMGDWEKARFEVMLGTLDCSPPRETT